jgi:septal ring factor EnvC (AmiA/AmiB activator)
MFRTATPRFPSGLPRALALAGLAALGLAMGGTAAAAKDPEAELGRVKDRIEALQRDVRADMARRDGLAVQLRESEAAVLTARQRLRDAREKVAESDRRLRKLEAERKGHLDTLASERDALAAQLRAAYVNGREEQLKLLLSQQDPAALGRMLVYYSYLGKARAAKIGEIEAAVRRLEELTRELADERALLKRLEADAAGEVRALDAARGDRERALVTMNAQIKGRSDALARLKREAAALEKLVADLRRALEQAPPPLEGGQPFERVRGRLPWPVSGTLTSRFGQPRGGGLKWNGVVIATARGTQVRAPYGGRVVYADWLPGLGLLLILDHGGGYLTLYGHNEELFKSVGVAVAPGDVIATVGDSGGRERPELYVEVRKGTRALDPRLWFRRGGP